MAGFMTPSVPFAERRFIIMENTITLTIDEIHAIRDEHSRKTKDISFEKYRKLLDAEIKSTLLALNRAKTARNAES